MQMNAGELWWLKAAPQSGSGLPGQAPIASLSGGKEELPARAGSRTTGPEEKLTIKLGIVVMTPKRI